MYVLIYKTDENRRSTKMIFAQQFGTELDFKIINAYFT